MVASQGFSWDSYPSLNEKVRQQQQQRPGQNQPGQQQQMQQQYIESQQQKQQQQLQQQAQQAQQPQAPQESEVFDQQQMQAPQQQVQQPQAPQPQAIAENQNKIDDLKLKPPFKEEFSWDDYPTMDLYGNEINENENENIFKYLTRNAISGAAKVAAGIGGKFGDMQEFAEELLIGAPYSGGIMSKSFEQLLGKDRWRDYVLGDNLKDKFKDQIDEKSSSGGILNTPLQELVGKDRWRNIVKGGPLAPKLPTSSDISSLIDAATGGYTEPRTLREQRFQEIASDVGSVGRKGTRLRGVPNARVRAGTRIRKSLVNNLGIPVAANSAKNVVEDLDLDKSYRTWSKMAAWTAMSLMNNVNAKGYAADLMNEGRNGFPNTVRTNGYRYSANIRRFNRHLAKGDPRTVIVEGLIDGISHDIGNGKLTMRDLMTRYDSINAVKRSKGFFQLNKGGKEYAISQIDRLLGIVKEEINTLGRSNPSALNSWNNGLQAFSSIHRSNVIKNFVEATAKGPYAKILSAPVASMFGLTGAAAYKLSPYAGPGVTGIASATLVPAVYQTGKVAYRVFKSPVLARYYWDAMSAATKNNTSAFVKNYQKLNKEYEKKYSSEDK